MQTGCKKKIYDNDKTWVFQDGEGTVKAAYIPNNDFNLDFLLKHLAEVPFTRVVYINKYGGKNTTPRLTWAYGQVSPAIANPDDPIEYRGLEFKSEAMPPWLEALAWYCRQTSIINWGFDPEYNSVIIGKYEGPEDSIAFHTDSESFLAHHFCANVTIGAPRDFQFKTPLPDGSKETHEIKLANTSIFFFLGLEHALPKRAGANGVRYSISFRNMANNIGIGNSFYYCRGLKGAIDNDKKTAYVTKLQLL